MGSELTMATMPADCIPLHTVVAESKAVEPRHVAQQRHADLEHRKKVENFER